MGWVVAIIAISIAYVALAAFALPKLLFRTRYAVTEPTDRGVKKSDDGDTSTLVFEPAPDAAEYIERYAVTERDGKRELVCKLAGTFDLIDYDIVVFDAAGKPSQVFNVKDGVAGGEYTRAVEIPCDTDFVSVIVNGADDKVFSRRVVKNVSAGRIALFLALNLLLTAAAVIGIKACLAYMGAGIFTESFLVRLESAAVTAVTVAIAVAFDIVVTVVAFIARRSKADEAGK